MFTLRVLVHVPPLFYFVYLLSFIIYYGIAALAAISLFKKNGPRKVEETFYKIRTIIKCIYMCRVCPFNTLSKKKT